MRELTARAVQEDWYASMKREAGKGPTAHGVWGAGCHGWRLYSPCLWEYERSFRTWSGVREANVTVVPHPVQGLILLSLRDRVQSGWHSATGTNGLGFINTNARLLFARKYAGGRTLDNGQLMQAVQTHDGFVVDREETSRRVADEDARATTMQQGGGSA